MLQNSEDKRLAYILGVIEKNNIRFPLAEIVKKTGFSKSQVSSTLNGKIPVSDSFLRKFKKSFDADGGDVKVTATIEDILRDNAERIIRLEAANVVLLDSVKSLLSSQYGKSSALIAAELEDAIQMVLKRRMNELKKTQS